LAGALPRAEEVSVDWRVVLFAAGLSLATGIAFGLVPAIKTKSVNLQAVMNRVGRGSSGVRHRVEGTFAAGEVAMALVLLIGAGLMVRSLAALWRVNQGFNPDHAVTFSLSIPTTRITTDAETRARLRQFDDLMRRISGVKAVSVTLGSRPMIHDSSLPFWIDGQPRPATDNDMPQAMFYLVEAGFRDAMGLTLERGRFIGDHDDENAPIVIDIDDVFARTYFPSGNPIGKHVHLEQFQVEAEIVGVVDHVKQWGPAGDARSAIQAQFYYPFMQWPARLGPLVATAVAVVLRTDGDPAMVMGPVRQAVAQLDPRMIVYNVATLATVVSNSLGARRVSMILLSVFAALALMLACVGIYGVISYLVGQRTHEIGVRMAMGADRGDILRLVLAQGFRMALAGSIVGVAAAVALTRLMVNQLFGVSAHDPLTFGGVTVFLIVVALAACYLPARRATCVDPIIALRAD
jgi:predicted permease